MKYINVLIILGLNMTAVTFAQDEMNTIDLTLKMPFQYKETQSSDKIHPVFEDPKESDQLPQRFVFTEKKKSDLPQRFARALENESGITASGQYVAPNSQRFTVEGSLAEELNQDLEPTVSKFGSLKIKESPLH